MLGRRRVLVLEVFEHAEYLYGGQRRAPVIRNAMGRTSF